MTNERIAKIRDQAENAPARPRSLRPPGPQRGNTPADRRPVNEHRTYRGIGIMKRRRALCGDEFSRRFYFYKGGLNDED